MKCLTLNLHSIIPVKGLDLSWEERLEILADTICSRQYDIVALQEINQSIDSPMADRSELSLLHYVSLGESAVREDNAVLALIRCLKAKGINYYFSYSISHIGYARFEEGTAILSQYPPKSAVTLISSRDRERNNWTYRCQTGLIVRCGGTSYAFLSVHFGWWTADNGLEGFKEQWDRTLDRLKDLETEQVIMLGDFNGDPDVPAETYDYVTNKSGYYDACMIRGSRNKLVTAIGKIDGWDSDIYHQLDYIFSSKMLNTRHISSIFDNKNEKQISDHYGIEWESG